MKIYASLVLVLFLLFPRAYSQNTERDQWTWMNGGQIVNAAGSYGSSPGSRAEAVRWTDANGNLWLFGGIGFDSVGQQGRLNDLWKYDIQSKQWTWVSGDQVVNRPGIYGSKGQASQDNKPGSRGEGVSWTDANGNLWLFGGIGFDSVGQQGRLNDLWKYDIQSKQWTWVSGDQVVNRPGIYGSKGQASQDNKPGGRTSAISWVDQAGTFWLFGGDGFDITAKRGLLNDLWKYDRNTNLWTWVSGDSTQSNPGSYGTKGVADAANKPGGRQEAVAWVDTQGNLWLFGGLGFGNINRGGHLNDLWKYDLSSGFWTWINGDNTINNTSVYGTKGVADAANKPGGRQEAVAWVDTQGNLWLFGGDNASGDLNDLWKYSPAQDLWVWVTGDATFNNTGNYGTKGIAQSSNKPGARDNAVAWIDHNGKFWLFGGFGFGLDQQPAFLNDLWNYDAATGNWTWVAGDNTLNNAGVYQQTLKPGSRSGATRWMDAGGNLWLFGGFRKLGSATNYFNDLWKYDRSTNLWTWVSGDNSINNVGVYGDKGKAATGNKPGGRYDPASWIDGSGNLWLFGGFGYNSNPNAAIYLNDLWRYSPTTNQWTWVSGDSTFIKKGNYGVQGVPDVNNIPGPRYNAASWKDGAGNLWLFGGRGFGFVESGGGQLNDLWKYDPGTNQWTWISGDKTINNTGVYGDKGKAAAGNKPGGRNGAAGAVDKKGNFWLFAGSGIDAVDNSNEKALNDLWQFDIVTRQWTWISGDNIANSPGVYGEKGKPATSNKPGSRSGIGVASWIDKDGNFWFFGGFGLDDVNKGYLNDLWVYNQATNDWSWISGINKINSTGIYGQMGKPSPANKPGSRDGLVSWIDEKGSFWVFGGYGYDANGQKGYLNDLWLYVPPVICTPPEAVITPSGNITTCADEAVLLETSGGKTYQWLRNGSPIGGANSANYFADTSGSYDVIIGVDGCESTSATSTVIKVLKPISFSINSKNPSCDLSNGTLGMAGVKGGYGNGYEYTIDNGTNWQSDSSFINLKAGTYLVMTRDSGHCVSDLDTVALVNNASTVTATLQPSAAGCSINNGKVTVTGSGGKAPYQYTLHPPQGEAGEDVQNTTGAFENLKAATYPITITDSSGCTKDTTVTIASQIPISSTISPAAPSPICPGNSQLLETSGGTAYQWYKDDSLIIGAQSSTYNATQEGVYSVFIKDGNCSWWASNRVTIKFEVCTKTTVFVPSGFTPNHNKRNDNLIPQFINIKQLNYFKVYNRWGQLVYQTNVIGQGWDGTLKGVEQPSETYSWILECVDMDGKIIRRNGKSILIR